MQTLTDPKTLSTLRPASVASLVWRRHGSKRANSSSSIEDARRILNQHKTLELTYDDTYGCYTASPNKHFATLMIFVTEQP
jgi:hypothetical protein